MRLTKRFRSTNETKGRFGRSTAPSSQDVEISPSTRVRTVAKWGVVPVALMTSGLMVWQSSYSAFSSTTVNPTNNWSSGTVALSDDDTNVAMFTASGLKPGSPGTKCIAVTSTGTLASAVKMYVTSPSTTNALSTYIDLTVTLGTVGTFTNACAGFVADATNPNVYTGTLANLGTTATGFGSGLGVWAPTGAASETRAYKFVYTLNAATPNSAQGGTAAAGFTWEAQNT